jgi:hypothetical protein
MQHHRTSTPYVSPLCVPQLERSTTAVAYQRACVTLAPERGGGASESLASGGRRDCWWPARLLALLCPCRPAPGPGVQLCTGQADARRCVAHARASELSALAVIRPDLNEPTKGLFSCPLELVSTLGLFSSPKNFTPHPIKCLETYMEH